MLLLCTTKDQGPSILLQHLSHGTCVWKALSVVVMKPQVCQKCSTPGKQMQQALSRTYLPRPITTWPVKSSGLRSWRTPGTSLVLAASPSSVSIGERNRASVCARYEVCYFQATSKKALLQTSASSTLDASRDTVHSFLCSTKAWSRALDGCLGLTEYR